MSAHAEQTDSSRAQRETSVEAAAILLTLAMRETQAPVAELGDAFGRISNVLAAARNTGLAPPGGGAVEDAVTELAHLRAVVRGDLAVCVRSLQFHDRLIQQMAAVRNLLATLGDHALLDVSGFGAQRWEELLRTLRERLTADSQHQVFDLLLRTGAIEFDGRSNPERLEGSVELF